MIPPPVGSIVHFYRKSYEFAGDRVPGQPLRPTGHRMLGPYAAMVVGSSAGTTAVSLVWWSSTGSQNWEHRVPYERGPGSVWRLMDAVGPVAS